MKNILLNHKNNVSEYFNPNIIKPDLTSLCSFNMA